MAEVGTALQTTNSELVKCIEELRTKREEANKQIQREEEEKSRIVQELRVLQERLNRLEESLALKYAARQESVNDHFPVALTLLFLSLQPIFPQSQQVRQGDHRD